METGKQLYSFEHRSVRFEQSIARLTSLARSLPQAPPDLLAHYYLLPAMDRHNSMTADHMRRVGTLSFQLALAYSHVFPEQALSPPELLDIYYAGLVHDIGKLEIPNSILDGNGKLVSAERNHIRLHPSFTYAVLSNIPSLKHIAFMALCHHELWNGKGYPLGVKGERIPLGAHLITIADTYDAFIQHRPYFPSVSDGTAYGHFERNAGTLFNPRLMTIFEKGFRF